MAGKSFGEEFGENLAGKAVMWGPAIAGAILLGPVGIALGLVTSAVIVASGDKQQKPSDGNQPKD